MKSVPRFVLVLFGWCVLVTDAHACDVPVYSYALERWPSRPYRCFVFYRGALSQDAEQALAELHNDSDTGKALLDIQLQVVDVDADIPAPAAAIWRGLKGADLPLLVAAYPLGQTVRGAFWSAKLNMDAARMLANSPAADQIVHRLLAGQAAVWVLVESANQDKDRQAELLLTKELADIARHLSAPAGDEDESAGNDRPIISSIDFSIVRLSRSDPKEQLLVKALLTSEPDLETTYASEPIVFPVFGRARALYALVGRGINRSNIVDACRFLAGPCACDVEPGLPLPVQADWQKAVTGIVDDLVDLPQAMGSPEQMSMDEPDGPSYDREDPNGSLLRNVLLSLAIVAVAVLALAVVLRKRLGRN